MNDIDWRVELKTWLKIHSKTMPSDMKGVQQEFLERFPKEKLSEMSLEEYAIGTDQAKDSYCNWLERRTEKLGSIRGGSAAKFGVY